MVTLVKEIISSSYRYFSLLRNLPGEIKIRELKKTLPKDRDWSGFGSYLAVCRLAAEHEEIFRIFKRSSDYRNILEHVSAGEGRCYLDIIKQEGQDLIKHLAKFKENDLLGNPFKFRYDAGKFSPTTLRYIKVLVDLRNIFGDLGNTEIIEIGAGYGGQCKIISDVFKLRSYTIIDFDDVLGLIRKYLFKLQVQKVIFLTPDQLSVNKEYDLAISNYAFSECRRAVQDNYIDKVFSRAKQGYITYNADGRSAIDCPYNKAEIMKILSKMHAARIIEERPKTAANNFIIIWEDINKIKTPI